MRIARTFTNQPRHSPDEPKVLPTIYQCRPWAPDSKLALGPRRDSLGLGALLVLAARSLSGARRACSVSTTRISSSGYPFLGR